ncbi:ABC transporter ATP-binding protein [Actinomadura hibisca]|uniref:ABC transporter ATP-binding protein n=1 Tax=Actinomadura hibisca TaxID=68565 RepID=UPI0008305E72|nr:ABC transporter ATP-binding protein [Actinomadura hibisca]
MRAADRLAARTVRHAGPWPAVLVVGVVGGAVLQLILPYALGKAIETLAAGGAAAASTGGAAAAGDRWLPICGLLVAGVVACEALGVWASGVTGAQASARLRRTVVAQVLGVGPAMTRHHTEGDLITRAGLNAEEVGRAPAAAVTAAGLLVPTVGGLIALALIDPWLPCALAAGLVLITWVLRTFLRDTTEVVGDYQRAQGDIAARLTDTLAGARTIAAAGTADRETGRVLAPLPRLRRHGMRLWRANARAGVRAGLVVPLLEVVVLGVGGWRLSQGDMTIGELYAAARYVVLGAGLSGALGQVGQLGRARAAADRLAGLLSEHPVGHGDRALPTGPGALEFRGVGVDLADRTGLNDISVTIPGGSATAVVGRSGTGKSLLAALAGRLLDPERGTILLDGVPLRELSRAELRRAVGYAFERPVLYSGADGTLADTISLGRPDDPGLDAVRAAARAACADDFVRRLPDGYDTPPANAPMSGGERQRLGLARAILQGERLLILDDATSSLDTVTEQQVSAALTGELGGRTRIIVAHRVTTALRADQVLWIDDGRIRACGRHDELWRDPEYRAVFQTASVPAAGQPAGSFPGQEAV